MYIIANCSSYAIINCTSIFNYTSKKLNERLRVRWQSQLCRKCAQCKSILYWNTLTYLFIRYTYYEESILRHKYIVSILQDPILALWVCCQSINKLWCCKIRNIINPLIGQKLVLSISEVLTYHLRCIGKWRIIKM